MRKWILETGPWNLLGAKIRAGSGLAVLWIVAMLALAVPALAQTTGQGLISGTVTDSSGAAVVGATVTVRNTDTNVASVTTTNDTGYFEVRDLNSGPYEVSGTAKGFERELRTGITLVADQMATADLSLKVGDQNQTITITADVPLLDTQRVSVTQVLTEEEIQALPNGTSAIWLSMLAPGIQTSLAQNYQQNGGSLSWNGAGTNFGSYGRQGANEFSLDGAPNMGNQRAQAINPHADELNQQAITTTQFDATVGHTYGVSVTQTTKSGTNNVHGTVRERYDMARADGMQHFQGFNKLYYEGRDCASNSSSAACQLDHMKYDWPGIHENVGGASFGGPVFIPKVYDGRNKFFFFVGIVDNVLKTASETSASVPTQQELTGDFSDLQAPVAAPTGSNASYFTSVCGSTGLNYYGQYQLYNPYSTVLDSKGVPRRTPFCGNKIPANLIAKTPLVSFVNGLWPAPDTTAITGSNYNYLPVNDVEYRAVTNRYDYTINDSNKIFVRWTKAHYGLIPGGFTNGDMDRYSGPRWINTAAAGWSHILSNTAVLTVTAGATHYNNNLTQYFNYDKYKPSQLGLPSYLDTYAGTDAEVPILKMSGYTQIGGADVNLSHFRTLSLNGNVTWVKGLHTLEMGADWRLQNAAGGGPGNRSGTFTFDDTYTQQNNGTDSTFTQTSTGQSYAAFLLGVQTSTTVTSTQPSSRTNPYYGAYVGDTWRASRKLTVIPGVRFEYEFGPTEKHNQQIVGWNPNATLAIAPAAQTAYQAVYAAATAAQKAVLPASLTVQGGPIYAGVNGASLRQWENNWRVLPRIAVAYQVKPNTVLRAGYGLYFDTLNTLGEYGTIDNDGYSTSTAANSSTAFGTDFVSSAPPITKPLPLQSNGSYFNLPIGNSAGADYYDGYTSTKGIYDHSRLPARAQRGQISMEHQFGRATALQLAYVGSLTTNITLDAGNNGTNSRAVGAPNSAPLPASAFTGGNQPNSAGNALYGASITNPYYIGNFAGLAASNPAVYSIISSSSWFTSKTITVANLVRPYSQMSGLNIYTSIGESKFQEFQATLSQRISNGLVGTFAYQKNYQKDRDYFQNQFDASPSWESSNLSAPWRITASSVYTLPFGRQQRWLRTGLANALAGGFRLAGTYEVSPGNLLTFSNLFFINNTDIIPLRKSSYYTNYSTGTAYVQTFNTQAATATPTTVSGITTCAYSGTGFVTNSSCQPNAYNLRVFPTHVENVRQQGPNDASVNLSRNFHLAERFNLETSFNTFNVFNHQRVGAANVTVTNAQFGQTNSDNGTGRSLILQGLLRF